MYFSIFYFVNYNLECDFYIPNVSLLFFVELILISQYSNILDEERNVLTKLTLKIKFQMIAKSSHHMDKAIWIH